MTTPDIIIMCYGVFVAFMFAWATYFTISEKAPIALSFAAIVIMLGGFCIVWFALTQPRYGDTRRVCKTESEKVTKTLNGKQYQEWGEKCTGVFIEEIFIQPEGYSSIGVWREVVK